MPKISIILPVYNGEKYLALSIQSILEQTFTDWELIIVNDCSTDKTEEIAMEFSKVDERIILVNNQVNQRLPKSLNVGFSKASGQYLTWTSDDNIYGKNALLTMVSFLDKQDQVALVYCDYSIIDENGIITRENKLPDPETILTGNCVGACFLYRKEAMEKIGGYDPERFLVEDYDYWFRIAMQFELVHLSENHYQYRTHDGSLSATRNEQIRNEQVRMWMDYLSIIIAKIDEKERLYMFFDNLIKLSSKRTTNALKVIRRYPPYAAYLTKKVSRKILKKISGADK